MSFAAATLAAVALGLQTAISPCPLATNIAAVSFIARGVGNSRRVLLSGLLYAAGRTAAYMALALAILWLLREQLGEGTGLSRALGYYGPMALGPAMIVLGMLLLGLLGGGASLSLGGDRLQRRAAAGGLWWALVLGVVFAMSFCPVSAGLFFFALLPLSAAHGSLLALPLLYGAATGAPVIGFAFLMAFAAQYLGKAFHRLAQVERVVRIAAGVVFLFVGVWYSLKYIYGVPLPV